jgi:hypothetical protein
MKDRNKKYEQHMKQQSEAFVHLSEYESLPDVLKVMIIIC